MADAPELLICSKAKLCVEECEHAEEHEANETCFMAGCRHQKFSVTCVKTEGDQ